MNAYPLLALFAAAASASLQPLSDPAARPRSPSAVDPAILSERARAAMEADPAGFREENADLHETQRRWSQDPSLGQEECVAAKKEPRSCMEGKVQEMAAVLTPQALVVINSYVKLLPRGVSAAVPNRPDAESPAPMGTGTAAQTTSAVGTSASSFRPGPAGVQFAAIPNAPNAPPAPQKAWWETQMDYYRCLYIPERCGK